MNYYKVLAKCGHVGKGKYTEVAFPIYSESASEAAQYVLKLPKVKKQKAHYNCVYTGVLGTAKARKTTVKPLRGSGFSPPRTNMMSLAISKTYIKVS